MGSRSLPPSSAASQLRVPSWSRGEVLLLPLWGLAWWGGAVPRLKQGQSLPCDHRPEDTASAWLLAGDFSSCSLVSWRPPHSLRVTQKWTLLPLRAWPPHSY